MIVQHIALCHFRNHAATNMEFGNGVNVLLGANGQGKTNILEAVSYLALTKSFYAASDLHVLMVDREAFDVEGTLVSDGQMPATVRVAYRKEPPEKVVTVNGSAPDRMSDVIGRFPVVILSPEHAGITSGGPAERRRFMDLTLSQVSAAYLGDAMEYRRILRHRNRLLLDARMGQGHALASLDVWNESLARYGARIIARRKKFVDDFSVAVRRVYATLADATEEPSFEYSTSVPVGSNPSADDVALLLEEELRQRLPEEVRRGSSLVGPHRDDILFQLGGMSVHRYASQGQHKTLLVALKFAEHQYIRELLDETPMLLLDDLFSELDQDRSKKILRTVQEIGQCVITTTEETPFRGVLPWGDHHRKFTVTHGTVGTAAA